MSHDYHTKSSLATLTSLDLLKITKFATVTGNIQKKLKNLENAIAFFK